MSKVSTEGPVRSEAYVFLLCLPVTRHKAASLWFLRGCSRHSLGLYPHELISSELPIVLGGGVSTYTFGVMEAHTSFITLSGLSLWVKPEALL